jgi:hypothetical protein
MSRTLTDEDVEAIALRLVETIGKRLAAPPPPVFNRLESSHLEPPASIPPIPPKLAYTAEELCKELSLSRDSIYKLEASGRLKAMPGIRRKIYSRSAVDRLLAGGKADWQSK